MNRAAAIFAQQAGFLLVGGVIPLEFVFGAMAAFADDEWLAFFDPGHRNEKYLKIMIDALVIGLMQAADRTTPGLFVQNFRLWRYADYKEHFIGFKGSGFRVRTSSATCIITPKSLNLQIPIGCHVATVTTNCNDKKILVLLIFFKYIDPITILKSDIAFGIWNKGMV